MNERFPRPVTVGDRVRINRAPFDYSRRHVGKEGVVTEIQRAVGPQGMTSYKVKIDNPTVFLQQADEIVWATDLTRLSSPTPTPAPTVSTPEAPEAPLIDLKRAQALQVAKAILGDVTVEEIREAADFILQDGEGQKTLAEELAATAAARDEAAELARATGQVAHPGYFGGATVNRDRTDDDVLEINGNYIPRSEMDAFIAYAQAAVVVHDAEKAAKQATPF